MHMVRPLSERHRVKGYDMRRVKMTAVLAMSSFTLSGCLDPVAMEELSSKINDFETSVAQNAARNAPSSPQVTPPSAPVAVAPPTVTTAPTSTQTSSTTEKNVRRAEAMRTDLRRLLRPEVDVRSESTNIIVTLPSSLLFPDSDYTLSDVAKNELHFVAKAIIATLPTRVHIRGYTHSNDGSAWATTKVQAESIRLALARHGAPDDINRASAHYIDRPVATNSTDAWRGMSQHVEIELMLE